MPTIGHRIQVDAVNGATVFENDMPVWMQNAGQEKKRTF